MKVWQAETSDRMLFLLSFVALKQEENSLIFLPFTKIFEREIKKRLIFFKDLKKRAKP